MENGVREKMMSSALVILTLSWNIQVEKSSKPFAVRPGMLTREIWAAGLYLGIINM